VQAATILGGLHRQLGDCHEGIRVLSDALPHAVQLMDNRVEAQVRERLADCLSDHGDLVRAVDEYERAGQLYGPTAPGRTATLNAERLRARAATNRQQ
jgi:hypothetical protein